MALLFILVIGTAIWVGFDAKSHGIRKGLTKGFLDQGPLEWAVGTLLFWIILFPIYLGKRSELIRLAQARDGVAPAPRPAGEVPVPAGGPPRFCSSCGAGHTDEAAFCASCGARRT